MQHRRTGPGAVHPTARCVGALVLALSIIVIDASGTAADPQPRPPGSRTGVEAKREKWRQEMLKNPPPSKADACFAASYPDTQWHEVPCGKPDLKPYPPKPPKDGPPAGAGSP